MHLVGEEDDIEPLEMRCLKPKVGGITLMEDIPEHLPDTGISKIDNIIDGSHVLPLW